MRGLPTAASATPEASHSRRELGRAESRSLSEFGLPALGAGSSGWNMSRPEMGKGSGDPFGRGRSNIHSTVLQQ